MAAYPDSESQPFDYTSDSDDDGLYSSNTPAPSYRLTRFTRPLVDYVRNEWQTSAKYTHLSPSSHDRSDSPRWLQMILSIVAAPRFRRYVLVYLSLLVSCFLGWKFVLSPRLQEHASLLRALDPNVKQEVGGWFGTNALPRFDYIVQLRTLDPALLPAETATAGQPSQRRLIVIGDVHGCKTELDRLLDEVSFNHEHDHLIFTGDMINKGPDSLGVVDLARQYSASCVRGNHEDRVLLLRHEMLTSNSSVNASLGDPNGEPFLPQDTQERQLARELTDEQAEWLDTCPVILDVGQIANMGQVVVVHAGLVPGVDLEKQDPYSAMNMRTVDLDTHVPTIQQTPIGSLQQSQGHLS
ncbi:conserved hypothetical protein [Aspergillus terreus NIH2624]|uniref:Calcineurin-like phosphoesterase domain-containing protein n=1 Tax=Aspergillus terreus (strain NIH 2624 / FGSC A1156) TaxID=341663 RepID=Q0CKK0_ASPTN|nr:uncharacterized protein ATEG_05784 [Aspergillus terreus NIH2624]EAU33545.1 conserved hypothetical protein [Aspergillus terreus NIH2624]